MVRNSNTIGRRHPAPLLDNRLHTVAEMVRTGSVVADIGADHGYLVCHLVGTGKCPRAYAGEVNPGPLEAARRHIREAGLERRVEAVLSDGLRSMPGNQIDDIVLAGMGGELIAKLLTAVEWTRCPDKRYILQPMTRAEALRRSLYRNGYRLLEERAVEAGRFVYPVMAAAYTGEPAEVDNLFAHTGLLWDKDDPAARSYLGRVAARLDRQAGGLLQSADSAAGEALRILAEQIKERLNVK